jgi:hypothetical protein
MTGAGRPMTSSASDEMQANIAVAVNSTPRKKLRGVGVVRRDVRRNIFFPRGKSFLTRVESRWFAMLFAQR